MALHCVRQQAFLAKRARQIESCLEYHVYRTAAPHVAQTEKYIYVNLVSVDLN